YTTLFRSHGQAPGEQNLDGGIEPKNGDTDRAQKLGAAGLRVGAATERQDRSLLKLASAADCRAKLVRFELAEECLAEALEDLRDGEAARLFDALVEIDKAPSELPGEERTNGSVAGRHDSGARTKPKERRT